MIPLKDVIRSRTRPVVTTTIIVVNTLVFLLQLSLPPDDLERFIFRFGLVPASFSIGSLLTSMFVHGGLGHVGGNLIYLWIFGDNVEDRFGHARFLIFYLVCGLAATFAQLAFSADSAIPNLGASGAVAGVLGAYLLLYPRGQVRVMMGRGVVPAPALVVIGLWFVLQLFSGIGSVASNVDDGGGVAYMAHVGGFVAGFLLTFALRGKPALPA